MYMAKVCFNHIISILQIIVSYIKWGAQILYPIAYLAIWFHQINNILQIFFCQCQSKMIHQRFAQLIENFGLPQPLWNHRTESLSKNNIFHFIQEKLYEY